MRVCEDVDWIAAQELEPARQETIAVGDLPLAIAKGFAMIDLQQQALDRWMVSEGYTPPARTTFSHYRSGGETLH